MSRNLQQPSSSRYKISSPQPLITQDQRFPDSNYSPYPNQSPAQTYNPSTANDTYRSSSPAPRLSNEGPSSSRNGDRSNITGAPGSPSRPARSQRRDPNTFVPTVPSSSSNGNNVPSQRSRLAPLQTDFRSTGHDNSSRAAMPISPISPVSAIPPVNNDMNGGNGNGNGTMPFADSWAQDRNQRSQLRAQTSAAAQQASTILNPSRQGSGSGSGSGPGAAGGTGTDKLRNAVGAFMSASKRQQEEVVPARRPGKSEARDRARKERKEEVWDVGNGDGGGKFAEIDSVLRKIRSDWPFVMESDFSPSTLALSLLSQTPSSSLPAHPSLSSFMKLHTALSTALQSAVQAHFQTFAASLPAHATFLTTLGRAQQQVKSSKEALKEARDGFAGKGKAELAGVRARERMVRDMLKILDTVDHLKQVPDQLESLIGDKKFLQAALILVRSMKTINKPEIVDIGAVSELRAYFASQETTLMEIMVDELHNHIYLKTYYSDGRWRPYTLGQQKLPVIDAYTEIDLPPLHPTTDAPTSSDPAVPNGQNVAGPGPSSRFSRYLTGLSVKPSHDPLLDFLESDLGELPNIPSVSHQRGTSMGQAGSNSSLSAIANGTHPQYGGGIGAGSGGGDSGNPEADSFGYMETLLEALAAMGKLGSALDMVTQRVSTEIHALVETTLDEVEERNEQRRETELSSSARPASMILGPNLDRDLTRSGRRRDSLFVPTDTLQIAVSLDAASPPRHAAVLRDLFWTLYSKLAAVLESHRVVYEVSRWISSRRDFKDTSTSRPSATLNIPVLEVWKPVQQEVRGLLHNYLTDESQGSRLDRQHIQSINEILRDGRYARDRQKEIFKFADTDTKAVSNDLKAIDDSLKQVLKLSVPGLVNMQAADNSANSTSILNGASAVTGNDDRFSSVGKHRTLIPPNAFNVSTLFQPTLSFIQRASAIVPPGFEDETGAFSSVLEDFVVKVFLPQLDEKVTASFQQAVSGYDAYQVDRRLSENVTKPPLKSSVRVMALIHSLCVMLQTTPFHRENYSRLIVGVIVQYYQQCSSRFKELASLSNDNAIGAEPPLALPAVWAQREDVIKCLMELRSAPPGDRRALLDIEQKEVKLESGLLGRNLVVESQLITSNRKLEALSHLSQSLRWFIEALLDLQSEAEEGISPSDPDATMEAARSAQPIIFEPGDTPTLPLTRAMAQRYEAIVQTYEQLAEMVTNTIRLEIRCRVMCNLGASMHQGDFRLESEALEPDPDIVDLNTSITQVVQLASQTLSDQDKSFVFQGLGPLVDHCFIHAARFIKQVNTAGVKKIKRNIMSVQQSLRSIDDSPTEGILDRSIDFWDMYDRDPKEMLDEIRTKGPTYSFEDYNTMLNLQCKTDQSEASSSVLNSHLIDLHALSMSIEGWDSGEL